MATVVRETPYHDRRVAERRRFAYPAALRAEGMRVSWGGVFGGVLVALGFLLLMTALGVAVGISAAQPGETDAAKLGTGAAVWTGASLLLALFIGGMVSTRIGAIFGGTTGFFEGVLRSVDQLIQRLKDPKSAEQIAAATGMPASEVQATLAETAQRVENSRNNPAQAAAAAALARRRGARRHGGKAQTRHAGEKVMRAAP